MKEEEIIEQMHEEGDDRPDYTKEKNALYTERLNLESLLNRSDYKIAKCSEAQMMGLEMPYDVAELHAQRKQWRDRINAIDAQIAIYDGHEPTEEELLAAAKAAKIDAISEFDASANVNAFTVNGQPMWLNHDQRSRLQASVNVCTEPTMTKYFGGIPFTYPVDVWQQMLNAVELYAGTCQTVTEAHKADVNDLLTIADVEAFDITIGYPDKPAF